MLSKEKIEEAKETMQHWIEYEKMNKTKINKADELIKIQETLLQYIKELEISNIELDKENNRLEKIEFERDEANNKIKKLEDKMQADRMAEMDDYVICLIDNYLKMIGGENE